MSHLHELQNLLDDLDNESDEIYENIMASFEDGSTLICMVEALTRILVDLVDAHIEDDDDKADLCRAVVETLQAGLSPGERLQ